MGGERGEGRFKRFLGPCYELRGSHFRSVDSGTAWTETCEHFARGWKFLLGIRAASKEHLGCTSRILGLMSAILCDRVTEFWLEEYFISFFPLLLSLFRLVPKMNSEFDGGSLQVFNLDNFCDLLSYTIYENVFFFRFLGNWIKRIEFNLS